MKKLSITLALILLFAIVANAQMKLISVIKDGNVKYYTNLRQACSYAEPGSDIVIPGGVWDQPDGFDKEIHIYGAGHYPAYTGATEKTIIKGRFTFLPGSSNSTLTGLDIQSQEAESGGPDVDLCNYLYPLIKCDNIKISRCRMTNWGFQCRGGTNFKMSDCVVKHLNFGFNEPDNSHAIIERNIILGGVTSIVNAIFDHNIFIKTTIWGYDIYYSNITNNIFIGEIHNASDWSYPTYQNNIFNNLTMYEEITFPPEWHVNYSGNISGVNLDNIFVNYSTPGFDYGNDYHLKSTCPGKGAATDGTDLGIYGTASPYKDGAVPVIPHITSSQIGGQLIDGKLQINVTVEAQTK